MIRRRAALVVALVGGAATGDALWHGAMQARSSGPPPGWRMEESRVPYRLSELSGPLALAPDAWSLDFWRAIRPPGHGAEAISAQVLLPEGGQIELWGAADPGHQVEAGVGLVLERVGEPSASVVQAGAQGRRRLRCTADLPPPGEAPVQAAIEPAGDEVIVRVDGVEARCEGAARGAGPVIRPGLRRVQLRELTVGGEAVPPPGPGDRPLWVGTGALAALALVALELTRLPAGPVLWTTAPLLLALAIGGRDLRLWAETARLSFVPATALNAGIPLLGALFARALLHLSRALHEARRPGAGRDWPLPAVVAAGLPVVVGTLDLPGVAHPTLLALATVGGVGGLGLGLAALLRRLGSLRPRRAASWCVAVGGALGLAVLATRPHGREAVMGAMLAGTAGALLVWANTNAGRVRWLNLTSLAAVAATLLGAELTLRHTPVGQAWSGGGARLRPDDIYGWVPVAEREFGLMEAGEPSDYPSTGTPVRVPPPDGRPRLVAMGGSTTGGAFQNDDLSEFYPARLEELLEGRVQVLNQGVGGWTTWHIRRWLEREIDRLDPDLLTLYVGHNDLLTPVPAPYSELFAAWQRPSAARAAVAALEPLRLFQGLRYLLVSFRPAGERVAVPLEEARANLEAILGLVGARGGRVLLASEGLAPDPGPLARYNAMLAELGAKHNARYVDLAGALHAQDGAAMFLDDCHLTERGHRFVAEQLHLALRDGAMLPSDAAP